MTQSVPPNRRMLTSRLTSRLTDEGMTLIELLVAVIITAVILGPIAASIFIGLKTTDSTILRLDESHDRQLLSTYFPRDVLSAQVVDSATGCSPGPGSNTIRLEWQEKIGATADIYVAAYRVDQDGTEWVLNRNLCVNGGSPATVTVAHRLFDSAAASFTTPTSQMVTLKLTDTSERDYFLTGTRRKA